MNGKLFRVIVPLAFGAVFFITMPAFIYPGDNFAPTVEAANVVKHGRLGISYEQRDALRYLLEERGQYLFENDARRLFFSKYGIGNTAIYLVSCGIGRLFAGDGPLDTTDEGTFLLVVNVYNILFSMLAVFYLLRIAGLYTDRLLHQAGFAILSVFTTYLWYYLRAPTLEVYQVPFALMFFYHLARFLRAPRDDDAGWKHLCAATCAAGVLVLLKMSFLLLFPVAWLAALLPARRAGNLRAFLSPLAEKRGFRALVLPTLVTCVILLASNYYRFGSCFASGYGQWMTADGLEHDRFSPVFVPAALRAFLLTPGNSNVFLHYPLVLLALAGLPRFMRRHPREAILVLGIAGLYLAEMSAFSSWSGAACYGPRYLLHALVLASVPVLETMELIRERIRNVAALALLGVSVVLLAQSAGLQFNAVSCHYFAYDRICGLFEPCPHGKIKDYFRRNLLYGVVVGDVIDHINGVRQFYPLAVLAADPDLPDRTLAIARFEGALRFIAGPNYYFLRRVNFHSE